MIIQYTLQQEDMDTFSLYHYLHSPVLRRWRVVRPLVLAFLVPAVMLLWWEGVQDSTWPSPWFLACAAAGGVVAPLAFRQQSRKRYIRRCRIQYEQSRTSVIGSPVTITVHRDCLGCESRIGKTLFRWDAVERVLTIDALVLLYLGAMQALVIPMRAFANTSQREEFLRLVEEYRLPAADGAWVGGSPQEPKCPQCGYGLYHAKDHRCPDCGRRFEIEELDMRLAEWNGSTLRPREQVQGNIQKEHDGSAK